MLKSHQKRFMSIAFPDVPKGFDVAEKIAKAHGRLFMMGLSKKHFDKVAVHLVETLVELGGVKQELIDEVVAIVGPLRAVLEKGLAKALEHQSPKESEAQVSPRSQTLVSPQ